MSPNYVHGSVKKLWLFTAATTTLLTPSFAQQIVADGTHESLSQGSIVNTSGLSGTVGYGLYALNAGTIAAIDASVITNGFIAHGLVAHGKSSSISLNGGKIEVSGDQAHGVRVTAQAKAGISNVSIQTHQQVGHGVYTEGGGAGVEVVGSEIKTQGDFAWAVAAFNGAMANVKDLQVTTLGRYSYGLIAENIGVLTASDVVITTQANNAHGARSVASGSMIDITQSETTTFGGAAFGVRAEAGGVIAISDSSISTTGNGSYGLDSTGNGSVVNASNVVINTTGTKNESGATASGAVAEFGGQINVEGAEISITGESSIGFLSQARGTSFDGLTKLFASTVEINTFGNFGHGTVACSLGTDASAECAGAVNEQITGSEAPSVFLELGNSTINTSGSESYAGLAKGVGASLALTKVSVRTTGAGSHGGFASAGGRVDLTDSVVSTFDSASHGLIAQGSSTVTATKTAVKTSGADAAGVYLLTSSVAVLDNSTVTTAKGPALQSGGGDATFELKNGAQAVGGNGTLLLAASGTSSSLAADSNVQMFGDIVAEASHTLINASLTNRTRWQGASKGATNISLDAESVWTMTASSYVSDTVTNAGTIIYTAPLAGLFKSLTTTNYAGDNGTVVLNTHLGGDGSLSDRLVITGGAATGRTGLVINDFGGTGVPTTDGVKVVDAINGGTTTASAFYLGNGDYTTEDGQDAKIAGAYAYTLHRSPVAAGTDLYGDGYTADDWYLRSIMMPTTPGPDPEEPVHPRYHPSVPVYENYARGLQFLNRLPTLAQRIGNRYWHEQVSAQTVFCKDPARNFQCTPDVERNAYYRDGASTIAGDNNVWGRIEGLHGRQLPGVTSNRTDYAYDLWELQAGIDGLLYQSDAGKLIGGVTVHFGQFSSDASSIFGNGGIDTTGYGFGGTLTWYDANGFYFDAQGQVTWFDSDIYSNMLDISLANGNNGFGYALSFEGGKRVALNGDWTLTPQAQLIWSSVDFDGFTDPYGARVSLDKGDSLKGRLGLALGHERDWKDDGGQTSHAQVYGIVNLSNEFLDGTRVNVSNTKFDSRADWLTGGIGLGGTYSWADNKYAIYGEINADTGLKNFADSYQIGGTLGWRVKF